MLTIIPLETPSLGDRSYLAHDGEVAIVVDPQRDIDRVLQLAADQAVRIVAVFETHIHNDYVTGGLALAERLGANYYVNAEDPVSFARKGIRDGDVIQVSPAMTVRVIATPGHTFTHLSYELMEVGASASETVAVFTGGSLLFGSTGRPDLLGPKNAEALARHQYHSAHRLAELPDDTQVMPTHGFGSFCSATQASGTESTIGQEKSANPVLTVDEKPWIADLFAGLDAWPAYYARMGPANSAGPVNADLTPPAPVDKNLLRQRIESGEWVVDLRTRTAFAAGHVPGTFNFGLDGQFSTYLGWLIPWDMPLTLLADTAVEVAQAQRELVRIGIDSPAGAATGDPAGWTDGKLETLTRATFAELAQVLHHRRVTVLDVRLASDTGVNHVRDAVLIPLHDLIRRIEDVPAGEVWVHCAGGYRASVAASILAAAGRQVVAVDDSFDSAVAAGLTVAAKAA